MISMSTGMWYFLLKWRNFSPRIVFFLKMNGEQLVFSKAVDGFITQFIAQSRI